MTADDESAITPGLVWQVYHMPIILGCLSVLFIALSITMFIKLYQTTTPITFSSDASEVAGEATQSGRAGELLVDVEGAVVRPGVYRLPAGSRIDDAIAASGGFSRQADTAMVAKTLNRAAKLSDGSKLYIPEKGSLSAAPDQSASSGFSDASGTFGVVNVNTASSSQLEALSGVGPVTAGKIIAGRPYLRLEELVEKKIVGQALFSKLKDQLTL